MEKKVVIVLLIIAILLSIFSITVIIASNTEEHIVTKTEGVRESGEISLTIAPPAGK